MKNGTNKYIFLILIIGLFPISDLGAPVIIPLPEINRPYFPKVMGDKIFVGELSKVNVFSIKTGKLITSFGKKGEGPEEFESFPYIQLMKDKVLVSTGHKLLYYTVKGEYLRECKTKNAGNWIFDLGNQNFIGWKMKMKKPDLFLTFNIYNQSFDIIKELYQGPFIIGRDRTISAFDINYLKYKNNRIVYAYSDQSFRVGIRSARGDLIKIIKRNEERIPFTSLDKKRMIRIWETNPRYKNRTEYLKKRTVFPKNYPPISALTLSDDFIYILTWKRQRGDFECFIFNYDGEFIKKSSVPIKLETFHMYNALFDIHKGHLYQLLENEEKDVWELHINKIL